MKTWDRSPKILPDLSERHTSLAARDKLALDGFIDALNDSDMEWAIHQGHPTTLQDASKLAHEYEAFKKGRGK